jgi:small-conductance mechanosensitive channel/CRP-like cAMP-binding protein
MISILGLLVDPLFLAGLSLAAGILATRLVFRHRPIRQSVVRVAFFCVFTILLAIAGVSPLAPTAAMEPFARYVVAGAFKIVWWSTAAWLLVGFLRLLVVVERLPSETRFLQDLLSGFVYLSAACAIITYVFDMPISGLLAASGVIAIVLGLALQSTLGDVFSGFVLNIARSYHPGDWVILDGDLQGRVIETNWRATQIVTANNDLAIIPNSIMARSKLINTSKPTKIHGVTIIVRLEPTVVPSRGCEVLQTALLSCNRILPKPAATVMIRTLDAVAMECELQFFVAALEDVTEAQNELFDLVFRNCASAGIRLAPPPGSPVALAPHGARLDPTEASRRLLDHLPIFAVLTDEERAALAPKLRRRTYKAGEVIIDAGVVAEALFILTAGALVALRDHGNESEAVVRFGPGDCFGEAGLLTGAATTFKVTALTKATVYEIASSDLAPILSQRPALAGELGQVLARRKADENARLGHDVDRGSHGEHLAERLADRVRELFGIT